MFKLQRMNRILMAIMVSLLLLGSISIANAWEVTVRNPTDKTCKMKLWDHRLLFIHEHEEATIPPGGSYTWDTGGYCPSCMKGALYHWGQVSDTIQWTNCLGNSVGILDDCTPCCWNASWHICKKTGMGDPYGFCKD
jgi:hypothetical protein